MSDPDLKLSDPWITSIQSLQPASTGIDERDLFYRAGFQAALRQQVELHRAPATLDRTQQWSLRWVVAALLLMIVASSAGYLTGRHTASEPPCSHVTNAPSTASAETPVVSDPQEPQPFNKLPADAIARTKSVRDEDNARINWLTRWMPRPFDMIGERKAFQGLLAFPSRLSADDWLMKNGVDAFVEQNLFPHSSSDLEVTELVSTGKPYKTLTPADVRELSENWEKMK